MPMRANADCAVVSMFRSRIQRLVFGSRSATGRGLSIQNKLPELRDWREEDAMLRRQRVRSGNVPESVVAEW